MTEQPIGGVAVWAHTGQDLHSMRSRVPRCSNAGGGSCLLLGFVIAAAGGARAWLILAR